MKRYHVLPDVDPEAMTVPTPVRTKIIEANNGEWVRYEDALHLEELNEINEITIDKLKQRISVISGGS